MAGLLPDWAFDREEEVEPPPENRETPGSKTGEKVRYYLQSCAATVSPVLYILFSHLLKTYQTGAALRMMEKHCPNFETHFLQFLYER